ncbi:hypothetical protein CLV47_11833 [Antricoccus suffuscus]|uniref:Conjugative transposon protein TcpC n=1 Tax=Antricoccus suffuscus TaxID=1629062 RepID=A0A2T0ZTI9_9ACTN|nr:conjugal transfer protein [Antricoccus suffuscus]PRZ39669.1 hypothetical protein CLV47_11833 [Antricoccus suffuscus]
MTAWRRILGFESGGSSPSAHQGDSRSPWQTASSGSASTDDVFAGFAKAKRRRGGHTAWVWLRNIAIALVVLAGINQLVIHPLRDLFGGQEKAASKQTTVDLAAAGGLAAGFATDYLSYGGPEYNPQRQAALKQWVVPGADAAVSTATWTGESVLRADSPVVEASRAVGEHSAAIAVLVRVQAYVPNGGPTSTTSGPAPSKGAAPAFVPPVPNNYKPAAAVWLRLIVPITTADARLVVAASGPVFSADSVVPVTGPGTDTDSAAAGRLEASALKIFASYATGDLQYITAPGTHLAGMSGQLTPTDISDVDVKTGIDNTDERAASVTVMWQLTGVDAFIEQTYGLLLSKLSTAPVLNRIGVLTPSVPEGK